MVVVLVGEFRTIGPDTVLELWWCGVIVMPSTDLLERSKVWLFAGTWKKPKQI
jgi:hypothetical protein